jgi:hypothetical protein
MSSQILLLEIIDKTEREKSTYNRDRVFNSQSASVYFVLEDHDILFYPKKLKGEVERPDISFILYKN